MRADLIEKSNIIKKLDKDLKAKEKLPSKFEFDKLNSNHEKAKIIEEIKNKINEQIQIQEEFELNLKENEDDLEKIYIQY